MPGIEYKLEGATRYRIFLPVAPIGDWFRASGSSFLVPRTNLLSSSVAHLPVFKVAQITATDAHFDTSAQIRQQVFFQKSFPQDMCLDRLKMQRAISLVRFPISATMYCEHLKYFHKVFIYSRIDHLLTSITRGTRAHDNGASLQFKHIGVGIGVAVGNDVGLFIGALGPDADSDRLATRLFSRGAQSVVTVPLPAMFGFRCLAPAPRAIARQPRMTRASPRAVTAPA